MSNDTEIKIKAKTEGGEEVKTLGGQMNALGGEIDKLSKNVDDVSSYQKLEKEIGRLVVGLYSAKERARETAEEYGKGSSAYARAEGAVDKLKRKLDEQRNALGVLGDSLRKNGVDTGNFASEQNRLQKELQDSQTSLLAVKRISDSMSLLGFKPHPEIKQEIDKLKNAYEEIRKTGTLSSTELAQAQLKLKEKMSELTAQTNGWKESLLKAKDGLIAFGASLAVFGAAAKQAIQFEDAMGEVRKTLDATPQQMTKITDEIKEMSRHMPMAADGLAKIAATGGQLGIAQKDIKGFTELAAKMGTAFDISAEDAGNAVGKLMNVLGMGTKEVELLGDSINKLGNNTAAREKDIVDVMVRVGSTGKMFGLAAQQTAALGDAFLSLGRPVDVTSTAMNGMLSKLQTIRTGSKDAQDALKSMGLSADKLASDINAKPQEALLGFLKTLEKLDKQSRAEMLVKIFGLEYQDDIGALIGSLGEYEKALAMIAKQSDYAGSMTEEYKKRLENTSAQLQLLKNNLTEIAVNFGTILLPPLRAVASALSTLAGYLADFVKEAPGLSMVASGMAAVAIAGDSLTKAFTASKLALYGFKDGLVEWSKTANQSFLTAAQGLGKLQTGFSVLAAGMIGWEIGQWLYREFETARIAGAALTEGLIRGWEGVRYGYELFMAVFTNDTVDAVVERHLDRVKEMEAGFVYMYDQAEKGGDKAKKKLEETGDAGKKAGGQIKDGADKAKEGITGLTIPLETTAEILQKKFGVDSNEALTGLDTKFKEASEEIIKLSKNAEISGNEIFAAFQKMRESANSTQEFQKLDEILKQLGQSGKISGEQIDYAYREMGTQAVKQLLDEIKKADDVFEFDKLKSDAESLYQSGIINSRQYGAALDQLKIQTQGTTQAVDDLAGKTKEAAGEEADHTDQVKKATKASEDEADALKEKAKSLEDEAKLLKDSAKLQEQKAKAAESQYKADEAAIDQAKNKLKVAEASGVATNSEINALKNQIEKLEAAAASSRKLAIEQGNLANDTKRAADALLDQAQKAKAAANELENVKKTTYSVVSGGAAIGNALKEVSEDIYRAVVGLKDVGSASVFAQTNAYAFAKSLKEIDFNNSEDIKSRLIEIDDIIGRTTSSAEADAYRRLKSMLEEAAGVADLQTSYQNMLGAVESGGAYSASAMSGLNAESEHAISNIKYLDDERLEGLKDSISEAKAKMMDFRDAALEAEKALKEMSADYMDELDRLAGNNAAIENRRYEKELAKLKGLYETAGSLGIEEYNQNMKLAEELHLKKLAQIAEQAAASNKANSSTSDGVKVPVSGGSGDVPARLLEQLKPPSSTQTQSNQASTATGKSAPSKVVEVRFVTDDGKTGSMTGDEFSADLLLKQLSRARMVS